MSGYTTIAEIKEYATQITGVAEDAILEKLITRVSRVIDDYCNRRFYVASGGDQTRYFDGTGTGDLWLPVNATEGSDLASVTSVAVRDSVASTSTWRTIALTPVEGDRKGDLMFGPRDRRYAPARLLSFVSHVAGNDSTFPRGTATVRIIGTFGFSSIPAPIAEAAVQLVVRAHKARNAGFSDAIGVDDVGTVVVAKSLPYWAKQMLDPYRVGQHSVAA